MHADAAKITTEFIIIKDLILLIDFLSKPLKAEEQILCSTAVDGAVHGRPLSGLADDGAELLVEAFQLRKWRQTDRVFGWGQALEIKGGNYSRCSKRAFQ